jgi:hypothetical protein
MRRTHSNPLLFHCNRLELTSDWAGGPAPDPGSPCSNFLSHNVAAHCALLTAEAAQPTLLRSCHSRRWSSQMAGAAHITDSSRDGFDDAVTAAECSGTAQTAADVLLRCGVRHPGRPRPGCWDRITATQPAPRAGAVLRAPALLSARPFLSPSSRALRGTAHVAASGREPGPIPADAIILHP